MTIFRRPKFVGVKNLWTFLLLFLHLLQLTNHSSIILSSFVLPIYEVIL